MSQTLRQEVSEITEQQPEIKALEEKVERRQERRTEAELKNREFETLQSALRSIKQTDTSLTRWHDLAELIGAAYDRAETDETRRKIRTALEQFTDRSFEDFADESEVKSVTETFNEYGSALRGHRSDVQRAVTKACERQLEEVSTKSTVLRIPDIGTRTDERAVSKYQNVLERIRDANVDGISNTQIDELARVKSQYEQVDIDWETVQREYELSDEAVEQLRGFLDDETVTLAAIDEAVLADLKQLTEFSDRLTIQFKGDSQ